MADLVGKLLDHFQIEALLGEGGMGAVYKARDLRLQRDVAIKVLHHHIAQQADFKKRFLQEARSAARLDHAGIVKVYYFGQVDDLLYIVMQFISGANLRQMLEALKAQKAWVPLDEGVQLVRQVSLALDYAHKRGVLHRDIKPNNIMIEPEPSNGLPYRPVITDLGLAKLAESSVVTREGSSMGTPAYMSPEQALGAETDARSDVYSLGILLYELTVGRVPFPAKTVTQAIRYHTKEPPPAPHTVRPDLPQRLERIILRALEKDPDDRYPDAAALAAALEARTSDATALTATPTAQMNAVSLITQYEQGVGTPRGPSILKEFDTPINLTQDSLQVLVDGSVVNTVALTSGAVTLGRSEDNDLALDDPQASRHHARIESDGDHYQVVDLDSRNGTFLGDVELLPGIPEVWGPDQALRIGETWLRLVRVQPSASPPLFRSDGTVVDARDIEVSAGKGWVGAYLEKRAFAVTPGRSEVILVYVRNLGPLADHFTVSIEGIPPAWLAQPGSAQLKPGQHETVTLTIRPPRTPESRAGTYTLKVHTASRSDPHQITTIPASLRVEAYTGFTSELQPQRIRTGKDGRITVQNHGNAPATFDVRLSDHGAALTFEPEHTQLRAEAGQTSETSFRASPRQHPLIGKEAIHPFSAEVRAPDGSAQTHQGEVVSKGRVPVWLPAFVALSAILVIGAGVVLPWMLDLLSPPEPKPLPSATAIVTASPAEVTETPGSSPTVTPSPTPTVDWEAVLREREATLLTQIRYREANGDVLWAYKTDSPPLLDGSLDEWTPRAYPISHVVYSMEGTTWQGTGDLYGYGYLAWDDAFLYLGVQVDDDVHAQTETGETIFRGDEVEIQVDTNLSADFDDNSLSDDDLQIGFSPGDFSALAPEVHIWRPTSLASSGPMVELAARKTGEGYTLETAIPWWVLQGRPPTETPVGITLNVSDNDTPSEAQQIRLLSNAPNRQWGDPTTWGTLILVDWEPDGTP
jgi:eukaryotic-like serine/threonine-protein kinase